MLGLIRVKRFNELKEKYDKIQNDLLEAEKIFTRNKELDLEISNLRHEIIETKSKIREQTEADLFFVSAKIQKKLLEGEKKENLQPEISLSLSYQNMLEQYNRPYISSTSSTSLLESLGLGSLYR
jgi:hypothetical protein